MLARGVAEGTSEVPTVSDPDSTYNSSCVLVYTITALFLMILSAITELIQLIFSSLVLHQICLVDKKERNHTAEDYKKIDPTAEYV